MATHGTVSKFQPNKEDWSTYVEQLTFYFAANGVTEDKQQSSILLANCGTATFKLIKSLLEAGKIQTTPFKDLVALVQNHYEPKPSVIVQRYKFNTRSRKQGESVAAYIAALRELAEHCSYGASLPEMLRDRLVCGINHEGIQRKLLAEKDLTYQSAYDLAISIETAERDSSQIKKSASGGTTPEKPLHFLKARGGKAAAAGTTKFKGPVVCFRCGGPHLAPKCTVTDAECKYCKKKGHLERVCKAKARAQQQQRKESAHYMESGDSDESEDSAYNLFTITDPKSAPILVEVVLNSIPVQMELDTGASVSVLSNSTYLDLQRQGHALPLQPSPVKLKSYTGDTIPVLGCTTVQARYSNCKQVPVVVQVVSGDGPNLLGRDWLGQLEVDLGAIQVNTLQETTALDEILDKHPKVFSADLGCMEGPKVELHIDTKVHPKFYKPRTVPFMLRDMVESELSRLEKEGIITPVKFSKWAAPIVPVVKKNGTVRICGDFKVTVNKALLTESYPLPRVDEVLSTLAGGKYFSKLDMSNAYLQLPLSDESKQYVVINTHRGLFQYNRLPFGVSSAPAIFQRSMETLLQGIKGVSVFIDDILISAATHEEHLQILEEVLKRLTEANLRLNRSKCFFLKPHLEHLGHIIDAQGRHPTEEKTRAIREAPRPTNVTELRSFLGIVNYYSKFLPNLSTHLSPLYTLLKRTTKWDWGTPQEEAFQRAKEALQANTLLVHYDPNKPMVLACDASQYGIGAVLSHIMEDSQERPIMYTSRTLNPAEKNYSQLEKEALAIVSAVKKFHNFLYGRHFTIQSDHKPLSFLFHEEKGIPQHISSRLQRWALTLSAYRYTIQYKAGKHLCNADALSRLPRPVTAADPGAPAEWELLVNHLSATCVTASHIKDWTSKDPVLSQVVRFILTGWPEKLPAEMTAFRSKKEELSVMDGCVLWGTRVLVPPPGRKQILEELHATHPGVSRMKSLARCYIWWPQMDSDIENLVRSCTVCQETRPSPASAPLHPWTWPDKPWSRLHLDFAGPLLGKMYLVLVDAHSKWMDVIVMSDITSAQTIEKLKVVFSTHGLPQKIVTDNGPSFVSNEFKEFMSRNGILHVTSAPYHPSTNGLAERAVQSFKQGLKRTTGKSIQDRLSRFLFQYRTTPHSTTGVPPAELLMGRRLRTRFDLLYPDISRKVESQQFRQKLGHDNSKPLRSFQTGDLVYVENFTSSPPKWMPGKVVKVTGPLSYQVEVESGAVVRRHVDNVRSRSDTALPENQRSQSDTESSNQVDPLTLPDLHPVVPTIPPATPAIPPATPPILQPPVRPPLPILPAPSVPPRLRWTLRTRTRRPNYRHK